MRKRIFTISENLEDQLYKTGEIFKIIEMDLKRVKSGTYWIIVGFDKGDANYELKKYDPKKEKILDDKTWYVGEGYITQYLKNGRIEIFKKSEQGKKDNTYTNIKW